MNPPYFWRAGLDPRSREAAPLTRALLTPLAALYTAAFHFKLAHAKPYKSDAIVICIGNLTVGGVGKTPIVAALVKRLNASGKRAASLSRGYGGKLKGPLRVDPNAHAAKDVGDEPLLLAQDGEAWIGADRAEAARAMAADGVEVIIMDDGFQNPSLHKDIALVAVDSAAPFGNGYVIPKGPLREPVASGLARADGVLLVGDGPEPRAVTQSGLPAIRVTLAPTSAPPTGPLVVFAGIGRPEKVFESVAAAGGDVVEAAPFPDHHVYSRSDMEYLRKLASERGAALLTTTKDYARLSPADREGVAVFPIEAQFDSENLLDDLLRCAVNAN